MAKKDQVDPEVAKRIRETTPGSQGPVKLAPGSDIGPVDPEVVQRIEQTHPHDPSQPVNVQYGADIGAHGEIVPKKPAAADPSAAVPGQTVPFLDPQTIQKWLGQYEQPVIGGLQDIIKKIGGQKINDKKLPPEFRGHLQARNQALAGALQGIVDQYQKAIPAMGMMQFLQNLPAATTSTGASGLGGIPADLLNQVSGATGTPVPKTTG